MRINRMRTGIIVANKVDGKYYKVTNVSVQDGNQVGTAYKLCDNPDTPFGCDEELGEDWVLITEKTPWHFAWSAIQNHTRYRKDTVYPMAKS